MAPAERNRLWSQSLTLVEKQGVPVPRREVATYDDFLRYLKKNGISDPKRISSLRTAFTLIHNRRNLSKLDRRPLMVMVGNQADYNGAFHYDTGYPLLDEIVYSGQFNVVYVEASTLKVAKKELVQIHQQTGRKIQGLILAGHGTSGTLQLGNPKRLAAQGQSGGHTDIVSSDVILRGSLQHLHSLLSAGAQILLWACSNGSRSDYFNLADSLADEVPGRQVFSTEVKNNIRHIELKGGRIRRVEWNEKHGRVATAKRYLILGEWMISPKLFREVALRQEIRQGKDSLAEAVQGN